MKKALVTFAAILGALVPGAFALAVEYPVSNHCTRSGGGACTPGTPEKGSSNNPGARSTLLEFDTAPDVEVGDSITWTYTNDCNWGGIFAHPSYGSGHEGVWIEDAAYPAAGTFADGSPAGPVYNTNDYGNNPTSVTATLGPLDASEVARWNSNKQLQIGWFNGTYNGYAECQGGGDGYEISVVDIAGASTSSLGGFTWGCPENIPNCLVSPWSYLTAVTSTISEDYMATSSAIFGPYLHTILDTSTSTIPGCYITTAGETLDTLIGLVSGNPDGTQGNEWNLTVGGNDFSIDFRPFRASFPDWLNSFIEFERTVTAFALWGMAGFAMWRDWIGGDEHSSNA